VKKLFSILFLVFVAKLLAAQAPCCPKFTLVPDYEACYTFAQYTPGNNQICQFENTACRLSKQTYTVFPALLGFTYTFVVTNGTIVSSTTNQATIGWSNAVKGI
jgi:hypothetical protein